MGKSLMDEIESGMYDDLINAEIEKSEQKIYDAGTAEYLDWVTGLLSDGVRTAVFDDEKLPGSDGEKLGRLSSLYSFLVEKFALIPEEKDSGVFSKSVIYFMYKAEKFKMVQSYCEDCIITGIMRSEYKREYEELIL